MKAKETKERFDLVKEENGPNIGRTQEQRRSSVCKRKSPREFLKWNDDTERLKNLTLKSKDVCIKARGIAKFQKNFPDLSQRVEKFGIPTFGSKLQREFDRITERLDDSEKMIGRAFKVAAELSNMKDTTTKLEVWIRDAAEKQEKLEVV